jgi:hypothetical protein
MTDLLEQGMAKLRSIDKESRGRAITYARSGISAVSMTATLGRSDFMAKDRQGFIIKNHSVDFIVSVSDMTAFGKPQLGDTITDTTNGATRTFKVMAIKAPTSERHYKELDGYAIGYRIHTKEVG